MSKLTAQAVHDCMLRCLYSEAESCGWRGEADLPADAIKVEGVTANWALNPVRVAEQRGEIRALLAELPDNFFKGLGGGWSFLNACETRDGEQWGEHRNVQELLVLGIAAGLAHWAAPRKLWGAMPGGMPYVTIEDEVRA